MGIDLPRDRAAFLLAAMISAVIACAGSPAWGWVQTETEDGHPLAWSGACVYWTMAEQSLDNSHHDSPVQETISYEDLHSAVSASFQTWEDVECSYFRFIETEPTHCIDVGFHQVSGNANRIFFRQRGWLDVDAPWRQDGQVALTSVFYDIETGEILDVDIEFNAEFFELTTTIESSQTDIQNALTHELGHFVGLSHSGVHDATMSVSTRLGELLKRDLHEDDIEGLCTIYPVAQDPGSCLSPVGGLDVECDTAEWCDLPIDGLVEECTFTESVSPLETDSGCHCAAVGAPAGWSTALTALLRLWH